MKEELKKLNKKAVLKVSSWGTLGFSGTIITNDKGLYVYQYYNHIPKDFSENEINFIVRKKDLSDEEFKTVTAFIKKEVIGKEFEEEMIFDAGFDVYVCLDGITKDIKNNKGFDDEKGLYDKAEEFVKSLINEE